MPIQQLSEMLCTIQQNQALMMQKLLAPPPATLAPPPAPRRVVNFEPFKSGPSSSYLEPSTSYQQPQFFPGYQENRSSPKMLSTPPAIHTPPTRSQAPKETDKEVLWARCKVAIGNKRKQLRSNKRL